MVWVDVPDEAVLTEPNKVGETLDDRFREPGIRGTGSVFVDSSFEFCLNEDWYHGNMAARSRVGDDRGGN
jgi:hypothetical protein